MISAQNHRQLLNGSNLVLIFISVIFFSSCGIFTKTPQERPHHKRHRPVKKTKKKPSNIDTLKWPDKNSKPDKDIIDMHGTVKKANYVIDMLIPIGANKSFEDLKELEKSITTTKYLHYYGGVMLALKELEAKGMNITMNVYDAPYNNNRIPLLKQKLNVDRPDVIIGPKTKTQLKEIALYSKKKDITVVSPWMAIPNLTSYNPNFIQIKPSLDKYYQTIVENIDKNYSSEDVYLVGLKTDRLHKRRLAKVQKAHLVNDDKTKYNMFLIDKDSLDFGETIFDSLFIKWEKNPRVFILPNWASKDEAFIYNVLRKLNIEKGEHKVVVYGMPLMTKSSKIGYNLFKRLNIKVASPYYYAEDDWSIKKFRQSFYDMFNTFPDDYAYEGYDMMMFVGNSLNQYGTKFQYFTENKEQIFLNTAIKLQRKVSDKNIKREKLDEIEYFENVKVFILGFKFNKFIRL